jgi:hypothetical protein
MPLEGPCNGPAATHVMPAALQAQGWLGTVPVSGGDLASVRCGVRPRYRDSGGA